MKVNNITVIGGCNIDICATSTGALVGGDSNPGTVRVSLGGVGRNIAENLSRLAQNVSLISSLGGDQFTELIKRHAQAAGFDMSMCAFDETLQNSIYVCVNNPDGEMSVAVSDMRVCDLITPQHLERMLPKINKSDIVVIDANIPEDTVRYLAENCEAPLCADSVSSHKAKRILPALPRLELLKTNRIEAQNLTGIEVKTPDDVKLCADKLHEMGVKRVLITLGSHGAFSSGDGEAHYMNSLAQNIVNTTGCGDAFFAGSIIAMLEKMSIRDILVYGLGMAALCSLDQGAVYQGTSLGALERFINENVKGN